MTSERTNIQREANVAQHEVPLCGMVIDEADAVGTSDYEGTRYYS